MYEAIDRALERWGDRLEALRLDVSGEDDNGPLLAHVLGERCPSLRSLEITRLASLTAPAQPLAARNTLERIVWNIHRGMWPLGDRDAGHTVWTQYILGHCQRLRELVLRIENPYGLTFVHDVGHQPPPTVPSLTQLHLHLTGDTRNFVQGDWTRYFVSWFPRADDVHFVVECPCSAHSDNLGRHIEAVVAALVRPGGRAHVVIVVVPAATPAPCYHLYPQLRDGRLTLPTNVRTDITLDTRRIPSQAQPSETIDHGHWSVRTPVWDDVD